MPRDGLAAAASEGPSGAAPAASVDLGHLAIPGEDPQLAAMRGAWLTVDLGAIAANVARLRGWLAPGTHLMAVVKADGYGHGAMAVAQAAIAAGAGWLGVATVAEGLKLRQLGIRHPILLLSLMAPEAYAAAIAAHLDLVVADPVALRAIARAAAEVGEPARVQVKVDTGMTRVGAALSEAADLVAEALATPDVHLTAVLTHLACAEDPDPTPTRTQLTRFERLLDRLALPPEVMVSVCNSAGTLFFPEAHHDLVRPGLLLYGLSPWPGRPLPVALAPAMTVTARITQLREVPPNVRVGYGGSYETTRPTRLALLPVGYADGLPRVLSNRAAVLVEGVRCPLVGAISMDQCVADVSATTARVGDEVVLLGRQGDQAIAVEDWAALAGTIPYEIICGLGRRLPRVYAR